MMGEGKKGERGKGGGDDVAQDGIEQRGGNGGERGVGEVGGADGVRRRRRRRSRVKDGGREAAVVKKGERGHGDGWLGQRRERGTQGRWGEAGGGPRQQRRGGQGLTPKKGRGRSVVEKRRKRQQGLDDGREARSEAMRRGRRGGAEAAVVASTVALSGDTGEDGEEESTAMAEMRGEEGKEEVSSGALGAVHQPASSAMACPHGLRAVSYRACT